MNANKFFQLAARFGVLPWAAGFLAVVFAGTLFLIQPLWTALMKNEQSIVDTRAGIEQTSTIMKSAPDLPLQLEDSRKKYAELQLKTLKRGERSRVISAVTQAAEDHKIQISKIRPFFLDKIAEAKKENKQFVPSPFVIDLECRYEDLGEFFEALEEAPVLLSVESFSAEPSPLKPELLAVNIMVLALEEWQA